MKAREDKKIVLTANPDELRVLADKMEAAWERITWGDSTFVDFMAYGDGLRIDIHLDQEWFKQYKTRG